MLFKEICIIDENYQPQYDMNMVTTGNKITYIGKELPTEFEGDVLHGAGKVCMPGFFNMHCHVPMTLLRGYGEGLPLDKWLTEKVFPFEKQMTAEDIYWASLLGIAEMLKSGTVSFTDMYYELPSIFAAVEESGIKANLSHGLLSRDVDQHYLDTVSYNNTEQLKDLVDRAGHDRIKAEVGIHAEYTSHPLIVQEAVNYATVNKMQIHTHLSETHKEHNDCKIIRGMTPCEYMQKYGVLNNPVTLAHCVWIDSSDLDILKSNSATVVHCPSSNLKLGSGIAPIKAMLENGVRVTIGTDGAASNNNLNMLEEINLAAILHKGVNKDPMFLNEAKDILEIACKNGAAAQGRDDCGSIMVGNRADIVVFDLNKSAMRPVHNILSNVLYSADTSDVTLTMVDGKVLYLNGEFKTINIEQVLKKVEQSKERILEILSR